MRALRFAICLGLLAGSSSCTSSAPAPEREPAPAPLAEVERVTVPERVRAATPSYVRLLRVEGYGNPQTGELWMRAVEAAPGVELGFEHGVKVPKGVGVSAQAATSATGRTPGYCKLEYQSDGKVNDNPSGTIEFYNQFDATADPDDASSFSPSECYGRLPLELQTGTHSALFSSQGVGCALQHIGNFTGVDFDRVLLDVDVFNGDIAKHGPYGPPFTSGTVVTPDGRNAPYQDKGLWDWGPMPSGAPGQTSGPHLKEQWIYFMNGDSNDFNWTGYVLGEVFETCGDDIDDDCDGVADNGCAEAPLGAACYADADCASGHCSGAVVVSGLGEGGGELGDDQPGTCKELPTRISAGEGTTCRIAGNGLQCWGRDDYSLASGAPAGSGFTDVTVGGNHACALRLDGTAECWGNDADGQASPPASVFKQLSAGLHHNCGVRTDGTLECWGYGGYGLANYPTGTDFVEVSSGEVHGCALRHNGSISCWGDNDSGQSVPPGDKVFRAIAVGAYHSCAIRADDDGVECWGSSAVGQLNEPSGAFLRISAAKNHACGLKTDGSLACWGDNLYGQRDAPAGTDFIDVEVGSGHSCAVKFDGTAVCWGANSSGQSSVPLVPQVPTPPLQTLSSGWTHGCAIQPDTGKVRCWGSNPPGSDPLGLSYELFRATEGVDLLLGNSRAIGLASGQDHSCAVFEDGSVRCWGDNEDLQARGVAVAGDTVYAETSDPGPIDVGGPVAKVTAGDGHTCVLRQDASVLCWGRNDTGAIGQGHATTPVSLAAASPVPLGVPVADLCSGGYHNCALLQDGQVRCWGYNLRGQLGLGHTSTIGDNEPVTDAPAVQVLSSSELSAGRWVTQLACGSYNTCAILDDGSLRCWGDNAEGQLGQGNLTHIGDGVGEHPHTVAVVNVGAGRTVQQVTTGKAVTCALLDDATVKCWGRTDGAGVGSSCLGHSAQGTCGTEITAPPDNAIDFGAGRSVTELAYRSLYGTLCARLDDDGIKCWHENPGNACGLNNGNQAIVFPDATYTLPPPLSLSDAVLGQVRTGPTFTNCGAAAGQLCNPNDVAIDPTSGKVFVADTSNHRVLRYASYTELASGAEAELVFGQDGFITPSPTSGPNRMITPYGVTVDAAGTLWVADSGNHRVLRFASAASVATHGVNADGVLGQPDLSSNLQGNTDDRMNHPWDVVMASDDTLYVSESGNHRVTRFLDASVAADADGAGASAVLGQSGFGSSDSGLSSTALNSPRGLAVDGSGRLWVADYGNHRVLRFDDVKTLSSGAAASGVLGQPDLNTGTLGQDAQTLFGPSGVAADGAGDVYVADRGNDRVLRFAVDTVSSNGTAAAAVIGPLDFVSTGYGTYGDQFSGAGGVAVDPAFGVWVADVNNSRVLRFLQ